MDVESSAVSHLKSGEPPMVLIRVGRSVCALSSADVREMVSTPPVRSVPHAPPGLRGLINMRGQVMPLRGLREQFGLPSLQEETSDFVSLLRQREEDHGRWLDELEASVRERRAFTLTTDPHACAFGKWYDTFRTENLMFAMALRRFDAPHKRIHAAGAAVSAAMAAGRHEECERVLSEARTTTFAVLKGVFSDAIQTLSEEQREITLVLTRGQQFVGLAVDAVESVERLGTVDAESHNEGAATQYPELVKGVGRRAKDGNLVLVLDAGVFFPAEGQAITA